MVDELKYSQDWSGLKWQEKVDIIKSVFEMLDPSFIGVAAPPNQVVADSLHGNAEVSVLEIVTGKYTAYKIEDNLIIWICNQCGFSTTFGSEKQYRAGAESEYQQHSSAAHWA